MFVLLVTMPMALQQRILQLLHLLLAHYSRLCCLHKRIPIDTRMARLGDVEHGQVGRGMPDERRERRVRPTHGFLPQKLNTMMHMSLILLRDFLSTVALFRSIKRLPYHFLVLEISIPPHPTSWGPGNDVCDLTTQCRLWNTPNQPK
jgi:hypothetical protein